MKTPDMTKEQAKELRALRKAEAGAMKEATKAEKEIRARIAVAEGRLGKEVARLEREHKAHVKDITRQTARFTAGLNRQLMKLLKGQAPEAGALKSIRRRITVLEGRLSS